MPADNDLPLVLVVDDSPVDGAKAAGIVQRTLGWRVERAADGKAALEAVARARPAVVLTDLQMPELDGLGLVERLHADEPLLPVVLMTAHGSEEIAVEALRRGAASYVPKRNLGLHLAETLTQVLGAAEVGRQRQQFLAECRTELSETFVLPNNPAVLRPMVARLQDDLAALGLVGEKRRLRAGVAFEEALTNAMYHGNLEVSSDLRDGPDPGAYHRLAEDRRTIPPYKDRRIRVRTSLSRAAGSVTIEDEGPGFDPTGLPDPTDPENMGRACGRGLLLIRTFVDGVSFNPTGNAITLRLDREPAAPPGWPDERESP
ncbi:MAG TPA: response regulator [Gemmataceae bacterium]|jgi:CheY-like chemotaxis protein/anti-sigma regulatory factor (Ser/Thr protein kinase)|nr:response regulator [Gemmataceae bacterium]